MGVIHPDISGWITLYMGNIVRFLVYRNSLHYSAKERPMMPAAAKKVQLARIDLS